MKTCNVGKIKLHSIDILNVISQAVLRFPNGKCKGVWWMPRLEKAMKDAAWRRYASGRCRATFDPKMSEWGNPMR